MSIITRRVRVALPLLALLLPLLTPATVSAAPVNNRSTLCLVPRANPKVEHTIHVARPAADALLRSTLSYRGVCARYGGSDARGEGTLTAYSQSEHGVPSAVGVIISDGALNGLPLEPPTDGKHCFDKDGDGSIDPMAECADGYESVLPLNQRFRDSVDTPFTYMLINWNSMGHGPAGVYDKPHFDIHAYLEPNAERTKIRTGPCGELVDCADYRLGKILPDAKYVPPDFKDTDAVAPAIGNHLIDTTGPEFHGQPFTHTWIYGVWNGKNTFAESMVTKAWFDDLVDGSRPDQCFAIKAPQAYQGAGFYPTRYCLRHRDNRHELTASMEGFVHRQAS